MFESLQFQHLRSVHTFNKITGPYLISLFNGARGGKPLSIPFKLISLCYTHSLVTKLPADFICTLRYDIRVILSYSYHYTDVQSSNQFQLRINCLDSDCDSSLLLKRLTIIKIRGEVNQLKFVRQIVYSHHRPAYIRPPHCILHVSNGHFERNS